MSWKCLFGHKWKVTAIESFSFFSIFYIECKKCRCIDTDTRKGKWKLTKEGKPIPTLCEDGKVNNPI